MYRYKYYHFTEYKNLKNICEFGLIPQNGDRSKSVNDEQNVIYLSRGKLATILMFFAFCGFYNSYAGVAGDNLLEQANNFIAYYNKLLKTRKKIGIDNFDRRMENLTKNYNGAIKLKNQILNIKLYNSFDEYCGKGVYLTINSNGENIRYNNSSWHNSFSEKPIASSNIAVTVLRNKKTDEMIDSKKGIIDFFMATSELDNLYIEYKNTISADESEDEYQAAISVFKNYYDENKIKKC